MPLIHTGADPERFKFRARIDNFTTVTELQQSQERLVRGTFTY